MEMTTLCYIEKDDCYLMLHRVSKKNDVNKDKWIGVGGHFEKDETPEECLLREVKEETGLTLTSYQFRGIVTFISDKVGHAEYMCLYTADGYEGEMISCDEGTLEWVPKKDIYQLNLWEANRIVFTEAGISEEHISMPGICTCCNPEFLFSHRASQGKRGNLAAFLGICGKK